MKGRTALVATDTLRRSSAMLRLRMLVEASRRGEYEAVKSLLDSGSDASASWDGESALISAVRSGNNDVVSALIAAGADVAAEQQDSRMHTPLFLAAFHVSTIAFTACSKPCTPTSLTLHPPAPPLGPGSHRCPLQPRLNRATPSRCGRFSQQVHQRRRGRRTEARHSTSLALCPGMARCSRSKTPRSTRRPYLRSPRRNMLRDGLRDALHRETCSHHLQLLLVLRKIPHRITQVISNRRADRAVL